MSKLSPFYEVKVNFRELSLIQLNTPQSEIEKFKNELLHEDFRICYLKLEAESLMFFSDKKSDDKSLCFAILSVKKLSSHLSAISQKLSFYRQGSKYAIMEIRANITILEAINRFTQTFSGLSKERGPLSYNPSDKIRESPFSSSTTDTNLMGFLHLALIALIVAKASDIFSNIRRGNFTLGKIPATITLNQFIWMVFMYFAPFVTQWTIDFLAFKKSLKNIKIITILYIINFLFLMVGPNIIMIKLDVNPVTGIVYFTYIFSNAMKIISYAHTNYNIRKIANQAFKLSKNDAQDLIHDIGLDRLSPENWEIIKQHKSDLSKICTLKGALYLSLAPTVCYQLTYPRLKKFRTYEFIKLVFQLTGWIALMSYIGTDHLEPILETCPEIVKEGDIMKIIEAYIKLSIPSTILWILFFFLIFHFLLNIHGEITLYGDREFYKEWWNCRDLNEYWRCWNVPAHNFFTRHIYYPLIRKKVPRNVALMAVFVVSALLHEFWMSSALGYFTGVTTLVFVVQAPIMVFQKKLDKILKGSQVGNWLFWLIFCFVGQPLSIMSYYLLYYHKNYQPLIKFP